MYVDIDTDIDTDIDVDIDIDVDVDIDCIEKAKSCTSPFSSRRTSSPPERALHCVSTSP